MLVSMRLRRSTKLLLPLTILMLSLWAMSWFTLVQLTIETGSRFITAHQHAGYWHVTTFPLDAQASVELKWWWNVADAGCDGGMHVIPGLGYVLNPIAKFELHHWPIMSLIGGTWVGLYARRYWRERRPRTALPAAE